jgi:hypothetical protein
MRGGYRPFTLVISKSWTDVRLATLMFESYRLSVAARPHARDIGDPHDRQKSTLEPCNQEAGIRQLPYELLT